MRVGWEKGGWVGMGMGAWTDQIEQRSERGESGVEVDISFVALGFWFGISILKEWIVGLKCGDGGGCVCRMRRKNDSMMGFRIGDKLELLLGGLSIREGAWGVLVPGAERRLSCIVRFREDQLSLQTNESG